MKEDFEGCEVGQFNIIDEGIFKELSELLSALSNRTRLAILAIAMKQGEVCACRLQQSLGLPQPTVTVHLQKLYGAGLLNKREAWRCLPKPLRYLRVCSDSAPILLPIVPLTSDSILFPVFIGIAFYLQSPFGACHLVQQVSWQILHLKTIHAPS